MKILAARVRWNEEFLNDPRLEILADDYPNVREMKHDVKEFSDEAGELHSRILFAEEGGYVHFVHDAIKGNSGGALGGDYILKDGSVTHVKSGWSSRSAIMNQEGFIPSMEASVTKDPRAFERGWTFHAGHITIRAAVEALSKYVPGTEIEFTDRGNHGEIRPLIVKTPLRVV